MTLRAVGEMGRVDRIHPLVTHSREKQDFTPPLALNHGSPETACRGIRESDDHPSGSILDVAHRPVLHSALWGHPFVGSTKSALWLTERSHLPVPRRNCAGCHESNETAALMFHRSAFARRGLPRHTAAPLVRGHSQSLASSRIKLPIMAHGLGCSSIAVWLKSCVCHPPLGPR